MRVAGGWLASETGPVGRRSGYVGRNRSIIDDASTSAAHHAAQDSPGQCEDRCEVDGQNVIPLIILHPHKEIVVGDTRVVDENIDLTQRLLRCLGKLIQRQHQDVQFLQQAVAALERSPLAQSLVEETLGAAKGHLESMQELAGSLK